MKNPNKKIDLFSFLFKSYREKYTKLKFCDFIYIELNKKSD